MMSFGENVWLSQFPHPEQTYPQLLLIFSHWVSSTSISYPPSSHLPIKVNKFISFSALKLWKTLGKAAEKAVDIPRRGVQKVKMWITEEVIHTFSTDFSTGQMTFIITIILPPQLKESFGKRRV